MVLRTKDLVPNKADINQGEKIFKYGQIIQGFLEGVSYYWRQIDPVFRELGLKARLTSLTAVV